MESGFSLVELLITLLISMLVVGAVYTAFTSQQRSYVAQEQVVEMQQNIRAGIDLMLSEIRMAGYDPTGNANAGITVATAAQFGFTQDLDEDGNVTTSPSETITFTLNGDSDGDGIVDGGGVSTIGRRTGSGVVFQPIAENIEAIEFYYILANGTQTLSPSNPNDVRSIQISILARAANPDNHYTDTQIYTTASGAIWGPFNDNYRRRFLITSVRCRNMGL